MQLHTDNAEARFQALLEAAPDAIVIADGNGHIVIVNDQAEVLFGYQKNELLNHSVDMLLPENLRARHVHERTAYVAAPRTRPMGNGLRLAARRKDGTTFPVEISLSATRTDEGLLVTTVIRDVTERAAAAAELERQVQQRTSHLDALLTFSQDLLATHDVNATLQLALDQAMQLAPQIHGGSLYLYDAARDVLVLRADTHQGPQTNAELLPSVGLTGSVFVTHQRLVLQTNGEVQAALATLANDKAERASQPPQFAPVPSGLIILPLVAHEQIVGVLRLIRTQGNEAFTEAMLATLTTLANLTAVAVVEWQSQHQVKRLEAQQRDLTDRVTSAEAAVLQAARMAAVGQLAASIAHEINNPLYAARNSLYLVEQDLPEETRNSPFFAIAGQELGRIAGIIERMREFYRPQPGEFQPCDLKQVFDDTLALVRLDARHKAVEVIFTPDVTLPSVHGNADQLRQVVLNLAMNAIDAMPEGGTLTAHTSYGPTTVIAEIQDTGIGIPDDIRARLFEPFFTNKQNGTGLGLSISAHIVTQHGGHIEVESRPGVGSIFRVVLPRQSSKSEY